MNNELVINQSTQGFDLLYQGKNLISHSLSHPFAYVGVGQETIEMYRGNFEIEDRIISRIPLDQWAITTQGSAQILQLSNCQGYRLSITFTQEDGRLVARFHNIGSQAGNRFWFHLPSAEDEKVYGAGEQFSYFNLRGKRFPLWTSEQGVGRNKSTPITFQADREDRCGGDYWWTFFPQPTFVSSNHYFLHVDSDSYGVFDFRSKDFHELEFWHLPASFTFSVEPSMVTTVQDLSLLLGRQLELPEWIHNGIILGIQGGTQACQNKTRAAQAAGVQVAGIWAQDWEGIRMTSFGQRLMWNWMWDEHRYPGLPQAIQEWNQQGVHFLGYANPYVAVDTPLFKEAQSLGYLAKNTLGQDYLVDFGEFDAGMPDLTNPLAYQWYKDVIKKYLISFGLSGWMADFGEYLPQDTVLADGTPGMLAHNPWPALWAKLNFEAVQEAGKLDQVTFFMRAGYTGSQKWCPLMWAGDQNVDWSLDDGLASVIPAALSLAVCGHGLHHSDIGGYTTLYGMKRTKELFQRWAEFATFTPVMRTHEGNRPKDNWQFDSDQETLAHLARMTQVFVALKEYRIQAVKTNAQEGIPVMRPMFFSFEDDEPSWAIQDQYLFGSELLVAPVVTEGAITRRVHLPALLGGQNWVHFWTQEVYSSGDHEVPAPIGQPPVFYPSGSSWKETFVIAAQNS